jgi:hypothetical protein
MAIDPSILMAVAWGIPLLIFVWGLLTGRMFAGKHLRRAWAMTAVAVLLAGLPLAIMTTTFFTRGNDAADSVVFDQPALFTHLSVTSFGMSLDVDKTRKAAAAGDADAQFSLGEAHENGTEGLSPSATEAAAWYRRAAEQGHLEAQMALGQLYQQGKGVEKDDRQALHWFVQAARRGEPQAQFYAAYKYFHGEGTAPDEPEAAKWLMRGAEQGEINSQYCLGRMYELGRGLSQDHQQAFVWYSLALSGSGDHVAKALVRTRQQLTPAQLAQAHRAIAAHLDPKPTRQP